MFIKNAFCLDASAGGASIRRNIFWVSGGDGEILTVEVRDASLVIQLLSCRHQNRAYKTIEPLRMIGRQKTVV
jgi:hypothetical protein